MISGVQIRIKLNEKRTVPRRLGEAKSVNSTSLLNVMCDLLRAGEDHLT